LQLGGDFVLDPASTVVCSRPQRRDDRPGITEFLRTLEHAATMSSRTAPPARGI
jgi:hypothetical protein